MRVCICTIECLGLVNGPREHSDLVVSSRRDTETTVDGDAVRSIVDLKTRAKVSPGRRFIGAKMRSQLIRKSTYQKQTVSRASEDIDVHL